MVLKRWAMTSAVRPRSRRSSASRMSISVLVSTLEVASSRMRKRGLCARARAKLTSCRWPTEKVAPRSVTEVSTPEERAEADFLESALDVGAVNPFRAETHVRFQRAGEEKGVLQNDAEMAAEILEVEAANVHTVEKDFAALNIVETQKMLDDGGLAGAGVADDGEGLPGSNAEGNVAEHPVFIGRVLPAAIGEPDIAEFDFAAGLLELRRLLWRSNRHGLIEQLEDAL